MTLFTNIDEVRAIIADTGDVPVLSDEALTVILNACQSDIDFACGGPNQIGVVFENEIISFETIAIGNSLNVSFGDRGKVSGLSYYPALNNNVSVLIINSLSAIFISDLEVSMTISSYLIFDGDLYEFIFTNSEAISTNQFVYSLTFDSGTTYAGLSDIADGSKVTYVLADAGAYIPVELSGFIEIKKQAIIELITLRMNYDALQSMRDGTYSRVSADYGKERKRILSWVQERLM